MSMAWSTLQWLHYIEVMEALHFAVECDYSDLWCLYLSDCLLMFSVLLMDKHYMCRKLREDKGAILI